MAIHLSGLDLNPAYLDASLEAYVDGTGKDSYNMYDGCAFQ